MKNRGETNISKIWDFKIWQYKTDDNFFEYLIKSPNPIIVIICRKWVFVCRLPLHPERVSQLLLKPPNRPRTSHTSITATWTREFLNSIAWTRIESVTKTKCYSWLLVVERSTASFSLAFTLSEKYQLTLIFRLLRRLVWGRQVKVLQKALLSWAQHTWISLVRENELHLKCSVLPSLICSLLS